MAGTDLGFSIGARRVWRGNRGHVEFCRLSEEAVLVVLRGHIDGEAAAYLVAKLPALIDRPGTTVFWDSGELASHGPRVPAQVIPALARLHRYIDEVHVLIHSPLRTLTAAAAAASLAVGGELRVYAESERFDEALLRETITPGWSHLRFDAPAAGRDCDSHGRMALAAA